jgi:hypothetical protein
MVGAEKWKYCGISSLVLSIKRKTPVFLKSDGKPHYFEKTIQIIKKRNLYPRYRNKRLVRRTRPHLHSNPSKLDPTWTFPWTTHFRSTCARATCVPIPGRV